MPTPRVAWMAPVAIPSRGKDKVKEPKLWQPESIITLQPPAVSHPRQLPTLPVPKLCPDDLKVKG